MSSKPSQSAAIADIPANSSALMGNYARQNVSFVRGNGCWLHDDEGRSYLDGLCGISVTNLGHSHPAITKVISEQASRLLHTSNIFHIENQSLLADKLCALSGLDKAFFANSGAEANEAAVKLARLFAQGQGVKNPLIVTFHGSFHGRTLGMIAATAGDKMKEGFEPTLPGFLHLPLNDVQALQEAFERHNNIAGIMVEPVQGEGGINPASAEFLNAAQSLCQSHYDTHRPLMILDEVQSGNGRCGSYFAIETLQKNGCTAKADIITTAKALGNGIPIGACIASQEVAEVFVPGKHGSTFGGNPFATRVALEVIEQIESNKLAAKAAETGETLRKAFAHRLGDLPWVTDIRGLGLMMGIELSKPCTELVSKGLRKGVVVNVTSGNVLRLLPPLVMSSEETDLLIEKIAELVSEFG